ncbi:Rdx family protein [Alkalihalobacillus algicola]|nr:Rdx family protein [Alkalihalobacillus algicola]
MTNLELIPGSKGAFEVTVNGSKLHSKHETGEYPEPETFIKEMEQM